MINSLSLLLHNQVQSYAKPFLTRTSSVSLSNPWKRCLVSVMEANYTTKSIHHHNTAIPLRVLSKELMPQTQNVLFHHSFLNRNSSPSSFPTSFLKFSSASPHFRGYFSSRDEKKSSNVEDLSSPPSGILSLFSRKRLRHLSMQYGRAAIGTYVLLDLISISSFYAAIKFGCDLNSIFKSLGIEEMLGTLEDSWIFEHAGTFVVAFAAHKIVFPVRIALCVVLTPYLVRKLRAFGLMTTPKPVLKKPLAEIREEIRKEMREGRKKSFSELRKELRARRANSRNQQ